MVRQKLSPAVNSLPCSGYPTGTRATQDEDHCRPWGRVTTVQNGGFGGSRVNYPKWARVWKQWSTSILKRGLHSGCWEWAQQLAAAGAGKHALPRRAPTSSSGNSSESCRPPEALPEYGKASWDHYQRGNLKLKIELGSSWFSSRHQAVQDLWRVLASLHQLIQIYEFVHLLVLQKGAARMSGCCINFIKLKPTPVPSRISLGPGRKNEQSRQPHWASRYSWWRG